MKTTLITTTALMALATGVAAEQHSGDASADQAAANQTGSICETGFASYDQNGDGELGTDELDAVARASFREMDADGDGALTKQEYADCANVMAGTQSMESDRSAENMAEYDTDSDDVLTQQEFMQASADSYNAMTDDPNAETDITRLTFWPVSTTPGAWIDMSVDEAAGRTMMLFVSLDADNSGTIARDEWAVTQVPLADRSEAANMRFDETDADRSGDVSEDEYSGMIQERGQAAQEQAAEDYEMPTNTLTPDEPAVYYTYPSTM
ncbi:EF-hand domain-containing protein [Citreimonas salinaria]|uniref:EF hand n=1 Tax=Citreimonas salinaria TaxID=321339 RepID=A0A1H3JA77_9RHOB|nr:EF-hand domain-containing protein [Citreimonas salinaria]SDY36465.1 EF hand [Citreimonas salinaria]